MTELNHITRATHEDGRKLVPPRAWCGEPLWMGWNFVDAQHAALSIESDDYASWYVCLDCVDAITTTLAKADQQRGENAIPRKKPPDD